MQQTLFATFDAPGDALALEGGRTLAPYTLAYQTWGKLNADRSNAILIFHALSGDSHVSGEHEDGRTGWWDLMVGPGCAFDTDRYFIICANVLGGCKGSTRADVDQPGNRQGLCDRFSRRDDQRHGAGTASTPTAARH